MTREGSALPALETSFFVGTFGAKKNELKKGRIAAVPFCNVQFAMSNVK